MTTPTAPTIDDHKQWRRARNYACKYRVETGTIDGPPEPAPTDENLARILAGCGRRPRPEEYDLIRQVLTENVGDTPAPRVGDVVTPKVGITWCDRVVRVEPHVVVQVADYRPEGVPSVVVVIQDKARYDYDRAADLPVNPDYGVYLSLAEVDVHPDDELLNLTASTPTAGKQDA